MCIPGSPILLRHQSRAGVCCYSPFYIFLTLRIIAARCPSTPCKVPGNKLPIPPGGVRPPLCRYVHHLRTHPSSPSVPPPSHCALTATRHCKHQPPCRRRRRSPSLLCQGTRPSGAQGNGQGGKALRTPWPGRGFPGQFRSFAAAFRPVAEPLVNPPLGLTAAALMSLEEERGEGERTKNCTD